MSSKFYKLPVDIASHRTLLPSDKLLFAVLLDHQGDNGSCWPGISTLMAETRLARQTVLDATHRLELVGLLQVVRQGEGKVNHYTTSLETRPVEKPNRSGNQTTAGLETRPKPVQKLDPNQTDQLNQSVGSSAFAFVLKNKSLWHLPKAKLDEYRTPFPRLDVEHELRKAAQWLNDFPKRRKTADGMLRFVGGWLGRAKPGQPEPQRGDLDWLPTEEEAEKIMEECGVC